MLCAPGHLEWALLALKPGTETCRMYFLMVEGDSHIPCPAGSNLAATAQDAVGCLSCKGKHCWLIATFFPTRAQTSFSASCFLFSPVFPAPWGYWIPGTGFAPAVVDFVRARHGCPHPVFAEDTKLAEVLFLLSLVKTLVLVPVLIPEDSAGDQPLLDFAPLITTLPAQQSLTERG